MKNWDKNRLDTKVDALLKDGRERGVFSGAAVGIYRFGTREVRTIQFTGTTRKDSHEKNISPHTLFDLASLTKPLCTALSIFFLIQQKEMQWDTKVFDILHFSCPPELRNITVDQLLSHSSGLLAYIPLYEKLPPIPDEGNKIKIIQAFLREKTAYVPESRCLYSDIGFMLLGSLVERINGEGLDIFFQREITGPLQLTESILFRPLSAQNRGSENIAATEFCPWRQKLIQGEVHDEHAWLMNGVAGHAGLFGTVGGVMQLCEHILHQWKERSVHPVLSASVLRKGMERKYQGQTWSRGFDTPSTHGSSAGSYFSKKSVGHLGFTGTSFWIDPEHDVVVVFLSNRIHPTRNNEKIKMFRPVLHNTIMEELLIKTPL